MDTVNIVVESFVCSGKPHVKNTRLTAEFLQSLVATGWTKEEILDIYPYLKSVELEEALNYRHH